MSPGAAEIQATATVPELGLEGLATWGGRAEGREGMGWLRTMAWAMGQDFRLQEILIMCENAQTLLTPQQRGCEGIP